MPDIRRLILKAIRLTGGTQSALGQAIDTSQNAVFEALRRGSVTAEMARDIHHATNGDVPAWELRPDLWRTGQPPPHRSRKKAGSRLVSA